MYSLPNTFSKRESFMKTITSLLTVVFMITLVSSCGTMRSTPTPFPKPLPTSTNTAVPTVTPSPSPVQITVDATKGWQNTDVTVEANRPFIVQYISGKWTSYLGENSSYYGAEGSQYTCNVATCCEPLPGVPSGALIGKVGGETFLISLGGPFVVNTTGLLFVRINDCDTGLHDNQGEIVIKIIP